MTRRELLAGCAAIMSSSFVWGAHANEPLAVIVHPSNQENPSRAEVATMFTTRKQDWGAGKRILPFNFPAKHDVRVSFDQAVLDMDPDAVARYWIDRRIRGGNSPPKQIPNAQLMLRLVQKLDGAIGYVPASVAQDVRVLFQV